MGAPATDGGRGKKLTLAGAIIFGDIDRDCARCEHDPQLKVRYGCTEETKDPNYWLRFQEPYAGEPLRRCPRAIVTREAMRAWEAYRWNQQGFLPSSGGIFDQPATYRQAMDIIASEVAKKRQAEEDAMRRDIDHAGQ